MEFIILTALIAVASAQNNFFPIDKVTGKTPPALSCPDSLCNGRADGNFEYYNQNYFLQCISGKAYCQACWPLNLKFSQRCNQCLYNKGDACITTEIWVPANTYICPDECTKRGYDFDGNVADPSQPRQYVACWKGMNVGCVACPGNLLFNEELNACLYEGKYVTEPAQDFGAIPYVTRNIPETTPRPTARDTTLVSSSRTPIYLNPDDYAEYFIN